MNYPALRADTASTASEIIHRAQAIRARLYRPANAVKDTALPPVPRDVPVVHVTIRRRDVEHDAHVKNWKAWKAAHEAAQAALNGMPCKSYIMARCEALGVSYDDVTGPSRERKITDIRQLLMYEIKTKVKPSISFPELGRLFGGRDHTTCLHACVKFGYQTGTSAKLSDERIAEIRRLRASGVGINETARIVKCATDTVRIYTSDEIHAARKRQSKAEYRKAQRAKARSAG